MPGRHFAPPPGDWPPRGWGDDEPPLGCLIAARRAAVLLACILGALTVMWVGFRLVHGWLTG